MVKKGGGGYRIFRWACEGLGGFDRRRASLGFDFGGVPHVAMTSAKEGHSLGRGRVVAARSTSLSMSPESEQGGARMKLATGGELSVSLCSVVLLFAESVRRGATYQEWAGAGRLSVDTLHSAQSKVPPKGQGCLQGPSITLPEVSSPVRLSFSA